jgi:hypothetical protein
MATSSKCFDSLAHMSSRRLRAFAAETAGAPAPNRRRSAQTIIAELRDEISDGQRPRALKAGLRCRQILLQNGFRTTGNPRPSISGPETMITCSPAAPRSPSGQVRSRPCRACDQKFDVRVFRKALDRIRAAAAVTSSQPRSFSMSAVTPKRADHRRQPVRYAPFRTPADRPAVISTRSEGDPFRCSNNEPDWKLGPASPARGDSNLIDHPGPACAYGLRSAYSNSICV